MGASYSNITLRCNNPERVRDVCNLLGVTAYISPAISEIIVVYIKGINNDRWEAIGQSISSHIKAQALAIQIIDDSVLEYNLYDNGALIDSYNSSPAYFKDDEPQAPLGGDADALCRIFEVPNKTNKINRILRRTTYVFQSDRHLDLVNALKLPKIAEDYNYICISQGRIPCGFAIEQFMHVPQQSKEVFNISLSAAGNDAPRKPSVLPLFLQKGGQGKYTSQLPVFCSMPPEGFLSYWAGSKSKTVSLFHLMPPWPSEPISILTIQSPPDCGLGGGGSPNILAVDSRFNLIATPKADALGINLWDVRSGNNISSISTALRSVWVGYREHNGKILMVVVSINQYAVYDLTQNKPIIEGNLSHAQQAAMHPSGILVVAVNDRILFIDPIAGTLNRQIEHVVNAKRPYTTQIAISEDGSWLFISTIQGVYAFQWNTLMASASAQCKPDIALVSSKTEYAYAYSMTPDKNTNSLLHAGADGIIHSLDLTTGITKILFEIEGRPAIKRIELSKNGKYLCCACQPGLTVQDYKTPNTLIIYDYSLL